MLKAHAIVIFIPAHEDVGQTALAHPGTTQDHNPGAGEPLLVGDRHPGPTVVRGSPTGCVGGSVYQNGDDNEAGGQKPPAEICVHLHF